MKIAYVLNTYPAPSHSFIRREIRALERQGFEVLRLAMRPADQPLVDPDDREEAARTRYILADGGPALLRAALRCAARRPRAFLKALRLAWRCGGAAGKRLRHLIYLAEAARVRQIAARGGAAHLHAHFGTNSATVAMLAHALGGPRFSFTVHGPEEYDAPAALSLGEKLSRCAFAVGVSAFGRSQLCRWAPAADWPRIAVVPCGVEPARFDDPAPLPEGPLRLVSIGRLVEQKGQMSLVPMMARLRERHPDARLTLVGDGPLRGDLESAVAAAGLAGAVDFAGWLDEAGVRAALEASHALVMPSFAEGLPMVVMEAMAAGRPVIATYIAGVPELVQPGRTGWLVPAGDAEALADAAAELAEMSPQRRAEMGRAGRARALARHDIDAAAGRLAALIRCPPGL